MKPQNITQLDGTPIQFHAWQCECNWCKSK